MILPCSLYSTHLVPHLAAESLRCRAPPTLISFRLICLVVDLLKKIFVNIFVCVLGLLFSWQPIWSEHFTSFIILDLGITFQNIRNFGQCKRGIGMRSEIIKVRGKKLHRGASKLIKRNCNWMKNVNNASLPFLQINGFDNGDIKHYLRKQHCHLP